MHPKNQQILFLIILAMLIAAHPCDGAQFHPVMVHGRVSCGGNGVPGVLVTDGESCTLTDSCGKYRLQSMPGKRFVYYTLPSGYESPVEKGVPLFYRRIDNEQGSSLVRNFDLLKSTQDQDRHIFIAWADPQVIEVAELELLKEVVRDVRETIAGLPPSVPVHGICCGDMVFDRLHLFDPYIATMAGAGIPFYHVIGNHDMDYSNRTHETSMDTYGKSFGPDYYSFNRGKVHYITLNDVFYYGHSYHYMGYLAQAQLSWLQADLAQVPKGSTVVVSLHIPTRYGESAATPGLLELQKNALVNAQVLYDMLKGYHVHILAGHSHTQWNTVISETIMEHTIAAASAAWWQGDVGLDGTPRGYMVFEAHGGTLTWYFKGAGRPKSDQFALYPAGSDPEHPGSFSDNVYDYDPAWEVSWAENGVQRGAMERYWGIDPKARSLYPPGKNRKYPWLQAGQTHHLFRASPSRKDAAITVSVTDRFGATYTRELK